ncbi:hypothetical protein ACOMHN_035978 [Nucella lapillus]
MATACERLDELVKEYLLFRGFTATVKALDHEVKYDKDRGLRADKIVEQLITYVGSHDLQHLREYWAHLNQRFFSRLEQRYAPSVRKLEVSLLKLYVVSAQQSNRQDRVRDFFEKIGSELQNQQEFRDWFVFPFVPNPAENGNFALYFTRQWQETVQLSLHNFLQVNYSSAPEKKAAFRAKPSEHQTSIPQPLPDLIYDFSGLADGSHEGAAETVSERQKPSRRFPINLSAPLLKRNKQPDPRQDPGAAASGSQTNQSSNNAGLDPNSQPSQHPPSCGSHALPGSGPALTSAFGSVPHQAGMSFSGVPLPQPKPSVMRRRKVPESSPASPYANTQGGKQEGPLPRRTSSLAATDLSDPQGEKSALAGSLSEPAVQEEEERESSSSSGDQDTVEPLQPSAEGKQCPFLVLSDDVYQEHQSAVCYSRFSLSGHHVASLDADGIVKVWTWSPQPSTTATVMSRAPFLSLDWASKSDRWLLLGNQSGQIRLFDTREIKTFREASVDPPNLRVTYMSASPSTMTFASCSSGVDGGGGEAGGRMALWDLKTMKMERYLPLDPQPVSVNCCVHSSNGKLLLAAGSDGVVRLYDLRQQQCVRKWRAGKTPQQTVQFVHQDSGFYTMGSDGVLSEWSLSQGDQPVRQIGMKDSAPNVVSAHLSHAATAAGTPVRGQLFSFSKDKAYLLCARHRHGIICRTGQSEVRGSLQRLLELSSHSDMVTTVDWSPCIDTPVCLTGARDGQLRVATLLSQ